MKKVLLVLILALMPIYVLAARVAATTETVASSSKTVFDDVRSMTSDLKEALTPLAIKLGQGAEHLYKLAVRQSYVEGWINLSICFLMLVLIFVAYKIYHYGLGLARKCDDINPGPLLIVVFSCAGICLFTGIFFDCLPDAIRYMGNPEYMAIKDLLEAVTK
jgi:hypothetical protein